MKWHWRRSDVSLSRQLGCSTTHHLPGFHPPSFSLPGGVGDVDPSEVDALAAHDEQRGEAEQGHAAADHGQLGRLASAQLQLLNDVAAQDDPHAGTGYNNHTWRDKDKQTEIIKCGKKSYPYLSGSADYNNLQPQKLLPLYYEKFIMRQMEVGPHSFINTGDNKATKTLFYYGIFQSFNTKTAAIQDLWQRGTDKWTGTVCWPAFW